MIHIELFNNLYNKEFATFDRSDSSDYLHMGLFITHGLSNPFLMHQVLATSALDLSIRTSRRVFYHEYATGLQNRALALFNETNPELEVTSANCVDMFLFSSMVGVHMLCDTLHYSRHSLEEFLDRFTHCISIFRGVLAICEQSMDLLLETEVGPHLTWSRHLLEQATTRGPECDALQDLVNTTDAKLSSRKVYQEAVNNLQKAFDVQRAAPGYKARVHVVFRWPILASPDFVDLLSQEQPEALVILAHYAALLHRNRHVWLIGDGGQFLIESICGSLGYEWQKWLEFPLAALR